MNSCRINNDAIYQRRPRRSPKSYTAVVEKILMQPWFLPKKVALAIHSMVPDDYRNKMLYMFQDYGCLVCASESGYYSNGMCIKCFKRTLKRMSASLRRRGRQGREPRLDLILFRQQKLARKLLSRFVEEGQRSPRTPHHGLRHTNPVYEAFAAKPEVAHTRR
jgi:hypothetical protein